MIEPEFEYLGPYHVEKILGRGGMGTVYKGVHAKSGEKVAIKVIATAVANQSRFRRRFEAEIKTLQKLKHPNIVTLKGVGEEKGLLFYTMEYVEGYTLHELMRQQGRIPWEDVIEIGIQTSAALKHAHDLGIIHRDLKPANLMLTEEGQLKLTDFGIAKLFGSSDMTAVGSVIGTADYMPPEQAEGKPVTVKSDLYGLGGVLYALISGRPPFSGKSVPEVLYSVRYSPVPRLEDLVGDVPPELCELIHQLLEKSPSNRPPTSLVVGNRLKALQQGLKQIGQSRIPEPGHSEQTEVSKKLTSLDLSDVDDQELRITNAVEDTAVGGTDFVSEEADSIDPHDQATMLAPKSKPGATGDESPTDPGKQVENESFDLRPEEPGGSRESSQVRESQLTSGGPSHYTPVEDSTDTSFSFATDAEHESEPGSWTHTASVVGMIFLLLACIGFGWWMLPKSRSASELYEDILAAVDGGDDGDLMSVKGEVQEFLERFPEDERAAEIEAISNSMELTRWTQILQRRARSAGGLDSLGAVEQGFLECMAALENSLERGQEKLRAFLKVFAPVQDLSRTDRRLIELAQFALESDAGLEPSESKAAAELQAMIQRTEKSLRGDTLNAYYRDLLLLFENKPWAKDQMARIRKKLEPEN